MSSQVGVDESSQLVDGRSAATLGSRCQSRRIELRELADGSAAVVELVEPVGDRRRLSVCSEQCTGCEVRLEQRQFDGRCLVKVMEQQATKIRRRRRPRLGRRLRNLVVLCRLLGTKLCKPVVKQRAELCWHTLRHTVPKLGADVGVGRERTRRNVSTQTVEVKKEEEDGQQDSREFILAGHERRRPTR